MANSTDQIVGRRRLVCAPRPPYEKLYEFNVITYTNYYLTQYNSSTALDFGNLALNDISIECWIRYFPDGSNWYRSDATPVGQNSVFCGWGSGSWAGHSSNTFGLGLDGTNASCTFGYGRSPPDTVYQVTGTPPDDGEWHHWCGTFDRSGLMTFYIDGVSLGTADISAEVAVNILTGKNYYIGTLRAVDAPGGTTRCMGLIGAAAFHTQVLTVEEVKASVFGKRTQRVANTVCAYDYREYTLLNEDSLTYNDPADSTYIPNGWTRDVRKTSLATTPLPYILLEDISGNGNDSGLRVPTWSHYVSFDSTWK